MVESLIYGLLGSLILLIISRFGIKLSAKMETKAVLIVMLMILTHFVFIGFYVPICFMILNVVQAPFVLGIGVGIFLNIIYMCYLALDTNVPARPRSHWIVNDNS